MNLEIKHLWIPSPEPHTHAVNSRVLGAPLWSAGCYTVFIEWHKSWPFLLPNIKKYSI